MKLVEIEDMVAMRQKLPGAFGYKLCYSCWWRGAYSQIQRCTGQKTVILHFFHGGWFVQFVGRRYTRPKWDTL